MSLLHQSLLILLFLYIFISNFPFLKFIFRSVFVPHIMLKLFLGLILVKCVVMVWLSRLHHVLLRHVGNWRHLHQILRIIMLSFIKTIPIFYWHVRTIERVLLRLLLYWNGHFLSLTSQSMRLSYIILLITRRILSRMFWYALEV